MWDYSQNILHERHENSPLRIHFSLQKSTQHVSILCILSEGLLNQSVIIVSAHLPRPHQFGCAACGDCFLNMACLPFHLKEYMNFREEEDRSYHQGAKLFLHLFWYPGIPADKPRKLYWLCSSKKVVCEKEGEIRKKKKKIQIK